VDTATKDFTPGDLRVSDADRDLAICELSEHFQAGRLTDAEFDERSSRALRARTESDLATLFDDLPGKRPGATVPRPRPVSAGRYDAEQPSRGLDLASRRPVLRTVAAVILIAAAVSALTGSITGHHRALAILPVILVVAIVGRLVHRHC
jgi:Domain of unknown function (DUF1707)